MATRQKQIPIDSEIALLVVDKEELKQKLEIRISIGEKIPERQINSDAEKQQMWTEFIDWNNYNEELIRQAFDKPKNIYIEEYKYKAGFGVGVLYGREKTFHEWVQHDKDVIKYQVKKLQRFFEKVDLLKSVEITLKTDKAKNNLSLLITLLHRFHKVAQALRDRHEDRETLIIRDEYDVQDLLNSLLHIHFDDVRNEDFSPSHAGANSRLDFVLKNEKIILEVKITSEKLTVNKLGQDLLIDIGRYKEYPDCSDLVIFIYDKGDFIRNKAGLITDLQKQSTSRMKVSVVINPI
jgi:hypothetical protein